MKIDSSRIAKIWDNLQSSSTIITIDDRNDIPNDRGLYLVHCPLLKSHEYLKFGKADNLEKRIGKDHMSGRAGGSVLNRWLQRDKAMADLTQINLEIQEERISFISQYCFFQILRLEREDYMECLKIEANNNLYLEWQSYWGLNKGRDVIEYIEKPIDVTLKDNKMVRYISGNNDITLL